LLSSKPSCKSRARAVQRRDMEPVHGTPWSTPMASPFSCPWLPLGAGLVILLTGANVSSADAKRAERFTGPWDLRALRQVPKVTTIKQESNGLLLLAATPELQGDLPRLPPARCRQGTSLGSSASACPCGRRPRERYDKATGRNKSPLSPVFGREGSGVRGLGGSTPSPPTPLPRVPGRGENITRPSPKHLNRRIGE